MTYAVLLQEKACVRTLSRAGGLHTAHCYFRSQRNNTQCMHLTVVQTNRNKSHTCSRFRGLSPVLLFRPKWLPAATDQSQLPHRMSKTEHTSLRTVYLYHTVAVCCTHHGAPVIFYIIFSCSSSVNVLHLVNLIARFFYFYIIRLV